MRPGAEAPGNNRAPCRADVAVIEIRIVGSAGQRRDSLAYISCALPGERWK